MIVIPARTDRDRGMRAAVGMAQLPALRYPLRCMLDHFTDRFLEHLGWHAPAL